MRTCTCALGVANGDEGGGGWGGEDVPFGGDGGGGGGTKWGCFDAILWRAVRAIVCVLSFRIILLGYDIFLTGLHLADFFVE